MRSRDQGRSQARRLRVISGCAGRSAARQVNLDKRTPTRVTRRPDDNALDLLS